MSAFDPKVVDEVLEVYAALAQLDPSTVTKNRQRRTTVQTALGWGYRAQDLIGAIRGLYENDWYVERGLLGLNRALKDPDTIDQFLAHHRYMNEPVTDRRGRIRGG